MHGTYCWVIGRHDKIIQSGVRSRVKRKEGAEMNIAFLIGRIIFATFWLVGSFNHSRT